MALYEGNLKTGAAIKVPGATATNSGEGFNAISGSFGEQLTNSATDLNAALAGADFTNPGTLLQMQQKMATYQVGLSVFTAMIKSFEDSLKGITQKM